MKVETCFGGRGAFHHGLPGRWSPGKGEAGRAREGTGAEEDWEEVGGAAAALAREGAFPHTASMRHAGAESVRSLLRPPASLLHPGGSIVIAGARRAYVPAFIPLPTSPLIHARRPRCSSPRGPDRGGRIGAPAGSRDLVREAVSDHPYDCRRAVD